MKDPPMAKRDKKGNLISSKDSLMNLYVETFVERLNPSNIKQKYGDIYLLKDDLWERRNNIMKENTTKKWNIEDLDSSLNRL